MFISSSCSCSELLEDSPDLLARLSSSASGLIKALILDKKPCLTGVSEGSSGRRGSIEPASLARLLISFLALIIALILEKRPYLGTVSTISLVSVLLDSPVNFSAPPHLTGSIRYNQDFLLISTIAFSGLSSASAVLYLVVNISVAPLAALVLISLTAS